MASVPHRQQCTHIHHSTVRQILFGPWELFFLCCPGTQDVVWWSSRAPKPRISPNTEMWFCLFHERHNTKAFVLAACIDIYLNLLWHPTPNLTCSTRFLLIPHQNSGVSSRCVNARKDQWIRFQPKIELGCEFCQTVYNTKCLYCIAYCILLREDSVYPDHQLRRVPWFAECRNDGPVSATHDKGTSQHSQHSTLEWTTDNRQSPRRDQ